MNKVFPNIVVSVGDAEASRLVQEKMLSMGASWYNSKEVHNTRFPCLYLHGTGQITYGSEPEPILNPSGGPPRTLLTAEEFLSA